MDSMSLAVVSRRVSWRHSPIRLAGRPALSEARLWTQLPQVVIRFGSVMQVRHGELLRVGTVTRLFLVLVVDASHPKL